MVNTTQQLTDLILEQSFTLPSALRHLRILKDMLVIKLFGDGQTNTIISRLSAHDAQWVNNLNPALYQMFNQNNLYQVFNETETAIKNIQTLTIFLPFEMPNSEIAQLCQFFRQSYGKNFLLEIRFDPTLIAGAALSVDGVYRDYSVRQNIKNNHQTILLAIKEHLKH